MAVVTAGVLGFGVCSTLCCSVSGERKQAMNASILGSVEGGVAWLLLATDGALRIPL